VLEVDMLTFGLTAGILLAAALLIWRRRAAAGGASPGAPLHLRD